MHHDQTSPGRAIPVNLNWNKELSHPHPSPLPRWEREPLHCSFMYYGSIQNACLDFVNRLNLGEVQIVDKACKGLKAKENAVLTYSFRVIPAMLLTEVQVMRARMHNVSRQKLWVKI